MGRFLRNAIFIIMAFAMLYVLVSPLVPTPNAVGKNNHAQLIVTVPALAAVIALLVPQRWSEAVPVSNLSAPDVIDLTCTRLC